MTQYIWQLKSIPSLSLSLSQSKTLNFGYA